MRPVPVLFLCLALPALPGCGAYNAAKNAPDCTKSVAFISPTTVTLDHSVAGNSQQFTSGVSVPAGCSAITYPALNWTVSNTVAATITAGGVASCKAMATGITVSSGSADTPNAVLTCN